MSSGLFLDQKQEGNYNLFINKRLMRFTLKIAFD